MDRAGPSAARAVAEGLARWNRGALRTSQRRMRVRDNDLAGIAVHIGARIGGLAHAGEVLVSTTVKDLVLARASSRATAVSTI